MFQKDPIKHVEEIARQVHDKAGEYTQPVLRRYPLTFAFLTVFSVAAILHGFELATDKMPIFYENPFLLIATGSVTLFLTGMLYKSLR
jgi:hypothetical protein